MPASPESFFPTDYVDSRRRFLSAAGEAGAALDGRVHETARGARGEALWMDAARLGPPPGAAEAMLLILSGTHGVEGFCGAGAQIGTLQARAEAAPLPPDTALLMVHAVNPYGFSWLRRVNEDNIDLNRNFIDREAGAPPRNAGYDAIRAIAAPDDWDADANLAAADDARAAMGDRAWRAAHSGGQYQDPVGIFYGGDGPSWSSQALFGLLDQHLAGVKRLAVLDYHTGLGPPGYGERIAMHDPASAAMARLDSWFGGDVTSTHAGTAVTVPLSGTILDGIERRYADAAVSAAALEFGTIDNRHVQLAVRADNWLHHHGALDSPQGFRIKQQIRDAFFVDEDWWKRAVWERGVETQRAMLEGLAL
ncbi:MAG: DUF2817 domain-containing protein [Marivibrio sp.]|uniref:DUF2817 domain-containing protein n=1 Tax=Marivibrio sp. TaxID=2039719 RepID=UPI0032F080B0